MTFSTLCAQVAAGDFACRQTPLFVQASTDVSAELLCPETYAQYLALNAPNAVAATDGFTAIADGNTLYVYNESANAYLTYATSADGIGNVQFDGSGNVYFLSDLFVYKLPVSSLQSGTPAPEKLSEFGCSGFLIHGDALYYTTGNKLGVYSLSQKTVATLKTETDPIGSALAYFNDTLYYFCEGAGENGYALRAIHPDGTQTDADTFVTEFPMQVRSAAIAGNQFCFTTRDGKFYAYNHTELRASNRLDEINPLFVGETGYVALGGIGDKVYAVQDKTVRLYATETTAFTDYEISASSSSPHRLKGASELCLSDDKLLIADGGNGRISVYNTETAAFETPIATEQTDPYLSAYGDTVLVSSSLAVLHSLSSKSYGETLAILPDEEIQGKIIGSVGVYGRYYVLTDENYCYTLTEQDGEWSWTETKKEITRRATAFAADVYGSLYVAYDNAAVYRFTETELAATDGNGEKILDGLLEPDKLFLDYATNLYALSNGVLQKYTPSADGYVSALSFSPDYGLVKDDAPYLLSFAFGVEENAAYLLYDGDYLVKTDELALPTVTPVPVGNANALFDKTTATYAVTMISKGAILIEFDLAALPTATHFPYVAFERCEEDTTALYMGVESGYAILAVSQERTGDYKTYLVLEEDCTALSVTDYKTTYAAPVKGYLTNNVSLFKYPYLTELVTLADLTRGEKVTIVGEIAKLDHGYYEIAYTTDAGEQTGYVPKAFVALFDGSSPIPETNTYGNTEADGDAVWRFAYLMLGLGAIGILIDVLLLRKHKTDDDDGQEETEEN